MSAFGAKRTFAGVKVLPTSNLSARLRIAIFLAFLGMVGGPAGMLLPVPPGVIEAFRGQALAATEDVTAALDGLIFDALNALLVVLEAHGSLLAGETHLAN